MSGEGVKFSTLSTRDSKVSMREREDVRSKNPRDGSLMECSKVTSPFRHPRVPGMQQPTKMNL